jgi:parallel beta-helix repeat protein
MGSYIRNPSRQRGFDVAATDHLTIDGFIVRRFVERGIAVAGSDSTYNIQAVTVSNCTSAENWKQGIYVKNCINCAIDNNVTYNNGGHGIYLTVDSSCAITRNRSYGNDDPTRPLILGSVAGIKLENTSNVRRDVRNINIDYNVVYDNEDSGIDLKGSEKILVRRNVSYSNGDHGYDNLNTDQTAFLNDVAVDNDHDGISIEDNATGVAVFNCIFAYNAVDGRTLTTNEDLAELFVQGTTGFSSDHNVFVARLPHGVVWQGENPRGLVKYGNAAPYDTLLLGQGYQAASGQDANSRSADPLFVSGATGDFKISSSSSPALDAAKTDVTGWLTPWWLATDPRGFVPHDNDAIPNAGAGTPNYAEIGAFEFDFPPAAITDLRADVVTDSSIHLLWTASGDDGLVGRAPSVDLRWSNTQFSEATWASATPAIPQPSVPVAAGSTQGYTFPRLPMCTLFCFGLKYGGGNGLWAAVADTAALYTRPVWINGHWACDEGGGERARRAGGPVLSAGVEPSAEAGAGVASRTAAPAAAAPTASGNPVVVEVIPASGGLDLRLMPLAREAPGDLGAGGGGVLYQMPDGKQGWTTRLHYDLPPGRGLALLLPERAGRWVFLDPLVVQSVPSAVVAHGTRWQLEQAHHSRLGDVTATLTAADQPPELSPGDTLAAHYAGAPAGGEALSGALVLLDQSTSGTTTARAGGAVREPNSSLPAVFALHPNRPNPFAATTTLRFDLPRSEPVRLEVFDLMGRRVARLGDGWMPAGRHALEWDRRDAHGAPVPPGAYLYRVTAGSSRAQRKLVVLP